MMQPEHRFCLIGPDGRPYSSQVPGCWGGHRRTRVYGRLDCPSAIRAIAAGGYVSSRVFFGTREDAVASGFRPCARCCREAYHCWRDPGSGSRDGGIRDRVLLSLLAEVSRRGAHRIALGHARTEQAAAEVALLGRLWETMGGEIVGVTSWPEEAASWRRPALSLAAGSPDLWVVSDEGQGWARMIVRLAAETEWSSARTLTFGSDPPG